MSKSRTKNPRTDSCVECGIKIDGTKGRQICSHECLKKKRNKKLREWLEKNSKELTCDECGNKFKDTYRIRRLEPESGRKFFCNQSCSSSYYIKQGTYKKFVESVTPKSGKNEPCFWCKKEVYVFKYNFGREKYFCEKKCLLEYRKSIRPPKIFSRRKKGTKTSGIQQGILEFVLSKNYTAISNFTISQSGRRYEGDILIEGTNKIIEVNGQYWHCDPRFYDEDFRITRKSKTAKQVWEYDKNKIEWFREKGYETLVVWEYDILKDTENTKRKILEFINEKN